MEEQQQQDEGSPPGTIEEELGDGLFQALLGLKVFSPHSYQRGYQLLFRFLVEYIYLKDQLNKISLNINLNKYLNISD